MQQYLLLLKGKKELDYSPEELQRRLEAYRTWVAGIKEHYVTDNRLERRGSYLINREKVKSDGPFLESKEIIAGFIIIQAQSLVEATAIARTSPLLDHFEIFVRPMIANE